ncbi:hypothetical protein ACFLXE_06425, partial [Chloroflexota bacterium]
MSELRKRFLAMNPGDYLHIAGWRVTPEEQLSRDIGEVHSFLEEVKELISRRVNVRAMVWYVPGSILAFMPGFVHARGNIKFVRGINNLGFNNGVAVLDSRLRGGVLSSHHQKAIVLHSGGVDYAYVGGIDIAADRWDSRAHDSSPERSKERFDGWHDIQCGVHGPAVCQIWDNFTERWNDRTSPHHRPFIPGGNVPSLIDPSDRPTQISSVGTHYVQVLRTLACEGVYSFAPEGEQTIRLAYERAIDLAEHYIYLEDQYFWPCSVVERLAAAAERGVMIIMVLTHRFGSGVGRWHNGLRKAALERVKGEHPENLFVYHLQQPNLG